MTPPLTAAERAEQIRRIVDQAPPLSPETRRRLRPITAGGLPPDMTQAQAARTAA